MNASRRHATVHWRLHCVSHIGSAFHVIYSGPAWDRGPCDLRLLTYGFLLRGRPQGLASRTPGSLALARSPVVGRGNSPKQYGR